MKEPHQRPLSFRANSFSRFAKRHGITMVSMPIDPYDLVDSASLKESRHFAVTLSVGDRTHSFTVVFPQYRTELPPIEDVLEYMANEATIHKHFGMSFDAYMKFTTQSMEAAWAQLQDLKSIIPNYKWLLGRAYYELIEITEERD